MKSQFILELQYVTIKLQNYDTYLQKHDFTSFIDILPLKMAATVRYLPCLGSQAAIMFLASNICWVNSGTVRDLGITGVKADNNDF